MSALVRPGTRRRCPSCSPSCGWPAKAPAGPAPRLNCCGDKAYSSRGHRAMLRARGIKTVIPEPEDQAGHRRRRGSRGGRPVSHDSEDCKNRNVVERFFNRMKNLRGLATRYDKHAVVYRGGVVLAAIPDWLKRP
ncbi:transposase [Nonomuraea sp. H19]|uniref:transposase n=1 Tax=Nonomuraea sp. H19 TaxID=3452206 RepID=UPI003F8CEEEF